MDKGIVERTLWYEHKDGRKELKETELSSFIEPLIILGEAGMGKSVLLARLGELSGFKYCTAGQLIRSQDPVKLFDGNQVLVIDALDEVSSQKEGAAVDAVLEKLQQLNYPAFILSCRVADWQSATAVVSILEDYSKKPIELHLMPFSDNDIQRYLSLYLGVERAEVVIQHFNSRGLNQLLGNPQTLELIGKVAQERELPNSRSELFERAIDVLWCEHKDSKAQYQLDKEAIIQAAGAAFAALILTGNEALTRKAAANIGEGEISFIEIATLPKAKNIKDVIATRLFKSIGVDRFSYLHRSIGEYLGAKWLAQNSNSGTNKRRFFSLFYSDGLVPASLRGIHAWLAQDPTFKSTVIKNDPMGFIEYGDADVLTVYEARILLTALQGLAIENPRFRDWKKYSIRGLIQEPLIEDLRQLIISKNTIFGLRLILLEAFNGGEVNDRLVDDLKRIILDKTDTFAIRRGAIEILVNSKAKEDVIILLNSLFIYNDVDSLRLVAKTLEYINYENVEDKFIVDVVVAYAAKDQLTKNLLYTIERSLPESRIGNFLDLLSKSLTEIGEWYERVGNNDIADLTYYLILREVKSSHKNPNVERFFSWLSPHNSSQGYNQNNGNELNKLINENSDFKLAIQKWVLLEAPIDKSIIGRGYNLASALSALTVSEKDLIIILNTLDEHDQRWKELIQLIHHDGKVGSQLRQTAQRFARHKQTDIEWLSSLAVALVPEWKIKEEEILRKNRKETTARYEAHRHEYSLHINNMRTGNYQDIINPAKEYLKLFNDIGHDIPAYQRIAEWLGDELSQAAFEGVEAYLTKKPLFPSIDQMQQIRNDGQFYEAEYIIIVATAERIRNGIGIADLSDEVIFSVFSSLHHHSNLEQHAGISDLQLTQSVEQEIELRGLWETAIRRFYEPQLAIGKNTILGFYELMHDDSKKEVSSQLAFEWLQRYKSLPENIESECIKRLIYSSKFEELRSLLVEYFNVSEKHHRLIWDAICFIVDFESITEKVGKKITPDFIWQIRDLVQGHYRHNTYLELSVAQCEWIVQTFRLLWPMATDLYEETRGSNNAWDASQFINSFIERLGKSSDEDAVLALRRLRQAPEDSYTSWIKVVAAEQQRLVVESNYAPPTLASIKAITCNISPQSMADLQALIIEELEIVQAKIKSDDIDSGRVFYNDDNIPHNEERCSSLLIGLLRQGAAGVEYTPEQHVSNDKEVDICCSVGGLRLPIEVKGQWHRDLWHAADTQLDRLYTQDWRAEHRGIYLVLWFGKGQLGTKRLKPQGRGNAIPKTAEELQEMLMANCLAAQQGRVKIVVLDLEING